MELRKMRGQGATEYLMVFGAVLLIALVAVVMMGFFPALSADAQIAASSQYWRNEAEPFAIVEHTISTGGNGSVLIQNADGRRKLTLINVTIGNGSNASARTLLPGETYVFTVPRMGTGGSTGAIYEAWVNISYNDTNGVPSMQYGSKAIIGRYA